MRKPVFPTFLLAGLAALSSHALAGEFPEPFNSEKSTSDDPIPATEAAEGFQLPDGFQITVFAAEPRVQNPVAMTWDHLGRMWVAENYTYAEKGVRIERSLRDRVLLFTDSDGDGVADERQVFLDSVQSLTSVEVGRGGVWLMCPPQLLFVPDAELDGVPDGEPQVVLDGFEIPESNHHNFANGLRWGPDNWLYGRCGHSAPGRIGLPGTPDEQRVRLEGGIWRYHPERQVFEALTHGTTNPWGHDWTKYGEGFFINTVHGHLWHLIPGAHFKEHYGTDPNPLVFERLDMHADHWHFDHTGSWMKSRDGAANEFGGGHAHIGMMIYQADQFPAAMRDKLYTINMHGRRTNVERLERHGSGFIGRHEPDIFFASDPWFRGIEISTGPCGSAFILDWSDTGECHDHTGVHRTSGRIYRIAYGKPALPALEDLQTLTPDNVERLIRHENVWFPRQLQIRLTQQGASAAIRQRLRDLADETVSDSDPVIFLRTLWAMNAVGILGREDLVPLLDHPHEAVRSWAIRLLTDDSSIDTVVGPLKAPDYRIDPPILDKFVAMGASDESGLVRLTLASTLQRLPLEDRVPLATVLAGHAADASDHNLPSMLWFGILPLYDEHADDLLTVLSATTWPDTIRWASRALAAGLESRPKLVNALLEFAATSPQRRPSILQGVSEGLQGWRKAPEPAAWDSLVDAAEGDEQAAGLIRDLSALFGDGRALDAIKAVALDKDADVNMRIDALETLIESRPEDLRQICEKLLNVRTLNMSAVRGLALFEDPAIGAKLARNYRKFYPDERQPVIDTLVARKPWTMAMLEAVATGTIPRSDITAYHARQIRALNDPDLDAKLTEVWGEIRESSEDKRQRIAELKSALKSEVLAKADLSQGRVHYQNVCAACHKLYGQGISLGPDLTGSGRSEIDYLLENIVDPNAVVGADYRMTILTMADGRTLSGVVASQTERTLTLRLLTEEIIVEKSEITNRQNVPISMMPEGLLQTLQPDQVRDLIAYLMHPTQVPLPE